MSNKKPCSYEDCENPQQARGLCNKHYKREVAAGTLKKITLEDRFWPKVDKTGSCWLWTSATRTDGYGIFGVGMKVKAAHRVSYELAHGTIPEGMFIDHICHTKLCVNPSHLRLATCRQNNEYKSGPNSNNMSSGVRGVSWAKDKGKWCARVFRSRKLLYCRYFDDLQEAEEAVKSARSKFYDFPEYQSA